MPSDRLKVIATRRLPELVETRLKELFDIMLREDDAPMSRVELVAAVGQADVLVPTLTDTIDAGLLAQAGPRLKLIANFGAGVDHIDMDTARKRGILVANTPGVVTEDTADMAMALVMAVTRRIPEGLALMQCGEWAWLGSDRVIGRAAWWAPNRYSWHGPYWFGRGASRPRLWHANSLP